MNEPCMSCGSGRSLPPPVTGCLKPSDHATPEKHQMWVWINGGWQIKGTGVEYINRPERMTGP